ncbi:MAG: type I-E CRISPR-associated protein Cse1/CasA [Gammaproteobacteria bacterium]|nr:type I-E CRISPR-associated protein Cse1/CasA [Gammaproteobacteria bacterium]
MNLIDGAPWLPVRRKHGARELILPWQITDRIDDDPIVALDLPRPDFNGSLVQFLIGLLQTAWTPEDEADWGEAYERPPIPAVLRDACLRYRDAFNVDGDGPRFLQDLELAGEEPKDIGSLLIDEPGGQTLRDNRDLFIKRGQYPALGVTAAVAALITLQTNAPSGGKGHRTSMRGGGPLTTLLVPDPLHDPLPANLWRLVWLNVLSAEHLEGLTGNSHLTDPAAIFPWLAPTRTSENPGGIDTTPEDAHPLQMYWGMPRRIRLEMGDLVEGECPMTHRREPLVTAFHTRSYGVNYTGAWAHPLSPHVINEDGKPLPLHPQPGGIAYRYWLGVVLGDAQGVRPAQVITARGSSSARRRRAVRLWAFGYDMDNAKARGWYESLMPVYHLDIEQRERFSAEVNRLLDAASDVARNLRLALKDAWFSKGATVRGDFNFAVDAFWQDTQSGFYGVLELLHRHVTEEGAEPDRRGWLRLLNDCSLALFDTWAVSGAIESEDPKRIAVARKGLEWGNYSKKMMNTLGLEIRPRQPARSNA